MATQFTPQQIADAIARIESGGNYKAHSKTSSASGKYQYVRGTWNNYGGYAEAWMAPPEVQDAKAIHDITNKLHAYGGDASKVIMSWFLPAAVNNPRLAAQVPKGNGISPNQYVERVMKAMGGKATVPAAGATLHDSGAVDYSGITNLKDPNVQIANLLGFLATDTQTTQAGF